MNTGYVIAMIAAVLAVALTWFGTANRSSRHRTDIEEGTWFLIAAGVLAVAACVFAGVGLNIQYFS